MHGSWIRRAAVVATIGVAACTGLIGGDGVPAEDAVTLQTTPAPGGLRRLTAPQYVASVRALLGEQAAAAAMPPDDAELHGFDVIAAAQLALPASAVEQYEVSARAIADAVIAAGIRPACAPTTPNDRACMRSMVESLGFQAWRRPLTDDELDLVTDAAIAGATHPDVQSFDVGVGQAIATLLQSPHFLYIVELGEGDGDRRWLTDYELVTRMSFFLLGATPDVPILEHARDHDLSDVEAVRELARDMLQDDRARGALERFFAARYRLEDLHDVSKNDELYPAFDGALATSMREETLRLIDDVVFERDADAREIFTADYTFVDARLAGLYGMTSPPTAGFSRVALPPTQKRSGVVGHASWLTRLSHPATTSPTRRGLFVRRAFLCDDVPPPPPGVETQLTPDDTVPKTKKEQLAAHQEDPVCATCHTLIDPIGLALESYDAIGAYREVDAGEPIDSASYVDDLGELSSASELGAILADDPRAMECFVLQLFRGAMGHLETDGERASIDALVAAFDASGNRIQDLVIEIVASPAFRMVGAPK